MTLVRTAPFLAPLLLLVPSGCDSFEGGGPKDPDAGPEPDAATDAGGDADAGPSFPRLVARPSTLEGIQRAAVDVVSSGDPADLVDAVVSTEPGEDAVVILEQRCNNVRCGVLLRTDDVTPNEGYHFPVPLYRTRLDLHVTSPAQEYRASFTVLWLDDITHPGGGAPRPVRGTIFASRLDVAAGGVFVPSESMSETIRWFVVGDARFGGTIDVSGRAAEGAEPGAGLGGGGAGGPVGAAAPGSGGGGAGGGGGGYGTAGEDGGEGGSGGSEWGDGEVACLLEDEERCGGSGGGGGSSGAGGAGAGGVLLSVLGTIDAEGGALFARGGAGAESGGGGGSGGAILLAGRDVVGGASLDASGGLGGGGASPGGSGGQGRVRIDVGTEAGGEVVPTGVAYRGPAIDLAALDVMPSEPNVAITGRGEPDARIEIRVCGPTGVGWFTCRGGRTFSGIVDDDGRFSVDVELLPGLNRLYVQQRVGTAITPSFAGTAFDFEEETFKGVRVDVVLVPEQE